MKSNILLTVVLLLLTHTTIAEIENELVTTTDVEISIQNNTYDQPSNSSLSLIDNNPANLIFYDKSGKPDSRMQITSSKLESETNPIIKLSITLFELRNDKWFSTQKTSIVTHENKRGEINISSQAQQWKLSAISKAGQSYPKDSTRIKNLKKCNFDFESSSEKSEEQMLWDGPGGPGEDPENCCSSQCQDGSGRVMKCCGALECCACDTCCSP